MKYICGKKSISIVAMAVLLTIMFSSPFEQRAAGEEFHLRVGYTGNAYQETTSKDIKAAVSILSQKVVWKYFGRNEAQFYDTIPEMAAALKSGKVQVLCGPPEEFLELKNQAPVDPILITASSSGHETELLLMVRKDSGLRTLSDLKNRSLVMPMRNPRVNSMFYVWIETLLMRAGQGSIESFFSSVKQTRTTSRGILPVFFRQADACVVTRQLFNLAVELNPQIGTELLPIARMGKLSHGIISVDRRLPEDLKEKIRQAFLSLPESPEGKQLLMLYQVSKMIPFRPEYLTATEALFAEYQQLRTRLARQ